MKFWTKMFARFNTLTYQPVFIVTNKEQITEKTGYKIIFFKDTSPTFTYTKKEIEEKMPLQIEESACLSLCKDIKEEMFVRLSVYMCLTISIHLHEG